MTNNITIKLEVENKIEKNDIEAAIKRNWSVKSENIDVAVMDHRVTLTGNVSSWYQKDEASRMAWSAPGVWAVDNQLAVIFDYDYVS